MGTFEHSVLSPHWSASPVRELTSDKKVLENFFQVELSWLRALRRQGIVVQETEKSLLGFSVTEEIVADISEKGWLAGNPAVGTVETINKKLSEKAKQEDVFHKGLTSQDLIDNSMMLMSSSVLAQLQNELLSITESLARLSKKHAELDCVTRTLNRYAEPSLMGFRFAGWLDSTLNAVEMINSTVSSIPSQAGGPAGNRAGMAEIVGAQKVSQLLDAFSKELGLRPVSPSWQTNRMPILSVTNALANSVATLSALARNLVSLGSPEVGELVESVSANQGGSSSMPHKQNPTRSILANSVGIRAPGVINQIFSACMFADERGNGEWHAEWEPFRELMRLAGGQATLIKSVFEHLEVDIDTVSRNLSKSGLSEIQARPEALKYMKSEITRIVELQESTKKNRE